MRLIVMGQQAFGKSALEAILEKGEDEVVAVYCAPDKEGKPVDPVKEFALEKGLPVYQPANFKDAEALDEMRALKADLCVMAYVIIFVPEEARNIPTHVSTRPFCPDIGVPVPSTGRSLAGQRNRV
jgi:methionyl-tRNA formyltransferase